jgi:hypothetical protein
LFEAAPEWWVCVNEWVLLADGDDVEDVEARGSPKIDQRNCVRRRAAEGQDPIVAESLERQLLIERAHIVPVLFQPAPDPGARDVRVE